MKNLKKVLALVLAIACAFTMFAGAAFTDEADIQATDAVNMLTALGVIEGFEDGSFQPDGTVTRAQMAKMIFVVRNNKIDDTAYKNNSTQFTDVNDNWAAGYIKFCESQGIIAGKSATQFKPNDTVTGVEAAKMLLVVAGYDPDKAGLTGANWKTNTLKWAGSAGLLDDVNAPLEEGLPRQYAAQVIYNALDANRVKWSDDSNSFDDILNGGVKETVGRAYMGLYNSVGVLVSIDKDALSLSNIDGAESDPISTSTVNGNVNYTYGTEFTKVATDYSDLMGQKVKVMFKDGKTNSVMGVAPLSDNSTWQVAANGTEKDDDKVKFDGKSYSVEYFGHDGSASVEIKAGDNGADAIATYVDGQVVNGTTLNELDNNAFNPNMYTFVDANGNGKIDTLIVKTYNVAKVTYASSDRIIAGGKTYKFEDENIASDIEKDDWVIITKNLFNDNKDIVKADETTDKVNGLRDKNSAKYFFDGAAIEDASGKYKEYMIGDTWYTGAVVKQGEATQIDLSNVKSGDNVRAVSVNGVLFFVERVTGNGAGRISDVAVVVNIGADGINDRVKLAFFDGTTATVNVDDDSASNNEHGVGVDGLVAGHAYEYTVSGNEYSFIELQDGSSVDSEYKDNYGDMTYKADISLDNTNKPSRIGTYKIDDDAQVILFLPSVTDFANTAYGGPSNPNGKTGNKTKTITGKQLKSLSSSVILTSSVQYYQNGNATNDYSVKVAGFYGDMNGLERIGAAVVPVNTLDGITTTYNHYGYIVRDGYKSGNNVIYTIWNGEENIEVQEKHSQTSDRTKGTVIGYDTLTTSNDVNVIDDVEKLDARTDNDTALGADITFTAITEVNNSKNTVRFATAPVFAGTNRELDVAGTVMYIDSDNDNWEEIGVKDGAISKAEKNGDNYMANALVIGSNDETELLIVEQGVWLKSDAYKNSVSGDGVVYGQSGTVTPSPDPVTDGEVIKSPSATELQNKLTTAKPGDTIIVTSRLEGGDTPLYVEDGKLVLDDVRVTGDTTIDGNVEIQGTLQADTSVTLSVQNGTMTLAKDSSSDLNDLNPENNGKIVVKPGADVSVGDTKLFGEEGILSTSSDVTITVDPDDPSKRLVTGDIVQVDESVDLLNDFNIQVVQVKRLEGPAAAALSRAGEVTLTIDENLIVKVKENNFYDKDGAQVEAPQADGYYTIPADTYTWTSIEGVGMGWQAADDGTPPEDSKTKITELKASETVTAPKASEAGTFEIPNLTIANTTVQKPATWTKTQATPDSWAANDTLAGDYVFTASQDYEFDTSVWKVNATLTAPAGTGVVAKVTQASATSVTVTLTVTVQADGL